MSCATVTTEEEAGPSRSAQAAEQGRARLEHPTGEQLSPNAVMRVAHELLVKWDDLKEREQLWSDLRTAMSFLGQAIDWKLPGRLRLVGVIVQVVEALSTEQAAAVSVLARQWLESVKRQQTHGNFQPLTLLSELGRCMEGVDMPASDESAVSDELLAQVLDASRTISLHLDADVLQKALVAAVVAKDMALAQQVLDELKLVCKFQAATYTEVEAREEQIERPLKPSEDIQYVDDVQQEEAFADNSEANYATQDVEDTLAAMMEMGSEELAEAKEVASEMVPAEMPTEMSETLSFSQKRKRTVLEEAIEVDREMVSPRRQRWVLSRSQVSPQSVRRNSLFDAPIRPSEMSGRSFHSDLSGPAALGSLSTNPGVLRESNTANMFHDSEVPSGGGDGGSRIRWTSEEEQRLMTGHERYGNKWEQIRQHFGLKHKHGVQLRDKFVNLVKNGRVRPD